MWVKFYEGLFAGDVGKVLWRIVQRLGGGRRRPRKILVQNINRELDFNGLEVMLHDNIVWYGLIYVLL